MNAPTPRSSLAASAYQLLPLASLVPSSSPVQILRRQGFTDASIKELADSFANGIGIVEPLIVRPHPDDPEAAEHGVRYEIIAGERRSLAAKVAGLDTVPCLIRDLNDAQALEIQMVENLQRNAYGALEEATGFRELLRLRSEPNQLYTAEALGKDLGKSRSYVYARLKLLDLCPEGQKALQDGEIDASKALLLARFRSPKLQAKALEKMTKYGYRSFRSIVDDLRRAFMADLARAPFPLDDGTLLEPSRFTKAERATQPMCMACTGCPHNSATDAELAADLDGAHVCTHAPCYDLKVVAFHGRRVEQARRDGRTVISGDNAREILPRSYGSEDGYSAEYLNLDAEAEDAPFPEPEPGIKADPDAWSAWDDRRDAWTPPSYREILGDTAPQGIILDLGRDGVRELIPTREAARLLKAKGYKLELRLVENEARQAEARKETTPADPEAAQRAREKEELARKIDLEYRARLYKAIVGKWKPPFKRFELQQIHELAVDQSSVSEELVSEAFGGKVPDEHKANETDLMRLIFALLFPAHEIESTHSKPGHLLDYAGRLKIDAKKIRAAVAAELTPKAEKAPAAKGKKK